MAPHAPQPVARCRRQERALTVRGSGAAPPTAHCAGGGYVAGSTMRYLRYLAADAGWNVRVRSFGPPSATAPRAWSTVTAWMRRTGGMMHSCRAPASVRCRELSSLCVFGAARPQHGSLNNLFHNLSWSRAISGAFRPSRAVVCHGIGGCWGLRAPCTSFWAQLGAIGREAGATAPACWGPRAAARAAARAPWAAAASRTRGTTRS